VGAKIEVYCDRSGEHRWRLVHDNGNVIADGSEGYSRRRDTVRAVERARKHMADAKVEIVTEEPPEDPR
jgi:uncharacterized protein YegP (UPF0339 family)